MDGNPVGPDGNPATPDGNPRVQGAKSVGADGKSDVLNGYPADQNLLPVAPNLLPVAPRAAVREQPWTAQSVPHPRTLIGLHTLPLAPCVTVADSNRQHGNSP